MGFFRFLFKAILVIAVCIGLFLFAARFNDGPLEIVAGGELIAGELHRGEEPDWSFVRDINTVEFQLLAPPRSRTTWIMEADGRVFIPSGYMTTWWGKIWKKWPLEAEKDGSRKYMNGAEMDGAQAMNSGYLWVFEVVPRQ